MPRRILMLSTSFPRYADGDAANAPFVFGLARAVSELPGYEVTALAPHCPGLPTGEIFGKIRVERFRYFWPFSLQKLVTGDRSILDNMKRSWLAKIQLPFFFFFFWLAVLRRIGRADIVHCHWLVTGFVALFARIFCSRPIVLTAHHVGLTDLPGPLARWVVRRVDTVITAHPELAEQIAAIIGKPPRIIRNFTNLDLCNGVKTREEIRAALNISPDAPTAIFVGRLSEGKDPLTLMRAIPKILQKIPDARFIIAGDGLLRGAMEAEVQKARCESAVLFLGVRQDVPELLRCADVFVSTNREDNALTAAIIEAGLSGLPLVLSALPKVREIFADGENAQLFAPGNDSSLAEVLVKYLREPALRAKLSTNSAKLFAGLGLGADEILRRTHEIYDTVCPSNA